MSELPTPQHTTQAAIFQHYQKNSGSGGRKHLGASEIGHECERYLWLNFRWAKPTKFEGRMLRLFETGQLQESRLVQNLRDIGVDVSDKDEDGKQWGFEDLGGHFGGSMDAAGLGFPEAPKTWHVVEFKTSNAKSFAILQKKGVKEAKFIHYAQMQLYMGWSAMNRAMYIVVNKDTDDIYTERVEFNEAEFAKLLAKAERVVTYPEPQIVLGDNPAKPPFVCQYCQFKGQCYGTESPTVNCRTCAHATATLDGNWVCELKSKTLTVNEQHKGCGDHRHIPKLLESFAELVSGDDDNTVTYKNKKTGNTFTQPQYSSQDITNTNDKVLIGDPGVNSILKEFEGSSIDPLPELTNDLPWLTEPKPPKKKK